VDSGYNRGSRRTGAYLVHWATGLRAEEDVIMRKSNRFPTRFPDGSKYVLEAHGLEVHRYIELPGGRRVTLPKRQAVSCVCATLREISIVPGLGTGTEPVRKKPAAPARRRVRALETV